MHNYIYSFFTEYRLCYASQNGFKTGHSTEYAFCEVQDRTIAALDSNETSTNIFLDLSQSFDTSGHFIKQTKSLWNKWHCSKLNGKLFE